MRLFGGVSTLFFGANIFFYNGINGLFVCLISFISKLLTYFVKNRKIINIIKYSLPLLAFLFYFNFNNEGTFVALLPTISLVFIVLADTQKDILKMKLWYYGSAFCWLFYGIAINSIPAILFDVVGIIILTYSVFEIIKNRHISILEMEKEKLKFYVDNLKDAYDFAISEKMNIKKLDSESSQKIYLLNKIEEQIQNINNSNLLKALIYIKKSNI
jgi:hypothetical protein